MKTPTGTPHTLSDWLHSPLNTNLMLLTIHDSNGAHIGTAIQLSDLSITDELCTQLAGWRNRSRKFFFDSSEVTTDSTRAWLRAKLVYPPLQAFWVAFTSYGARTAHIGVKYGDDDIAEIDALLRGESGGGPDFMVGLEKAVVQWTTRTFHPAFVIARTYSWNTLAGRIHRACGFTISNEQDGRMEWIYRY